jgi:hypothetical protein
MARPLLVVLAVVALVVSAGCSGLTGPGATATPEPTQPPTVPGTTADTSTGTQTTTDSAERLAPGLTSEGVEDALALSNAHVEQLRDASYRYELVTESDVANDSHSWTVTTLQYETESRWLLTNERYGALPADLEGQSAYYGDGERLYSAQNVTESPSYAAPTDSDGEPTNPAESLPLPRFARDRIYAAFSATDTHVVSAESENGLTVVHGYAAETTYDGETVTDFHVTATVTDEGVVQALQTRYTVAGEHFETDLRFDAAGASSVEEPSWYDDAVNATGTGDSTETGSTTETEDATTSN